MHIVMLHNIVAANMLHDKTFTVGAYGVAFITYGAFDSTHMHFGRVPRKLCPNNEQVVVCSHATYVVFLGLRMYICMSESADTEHGK